MSIKSLFNPKSVAVIGASRTPGKLGYQVLHNIIEAGYKGEIYPINPKAGEVLGLKCYRSIKRVPKRVEFAVVIVPAKIVPSVIKDCGKKGVKAAVIISGGFGEVGDKGEELERKAVAAAEKAKIRILGPNCQGVNDTSSGLCASWPLVKKKGPISIISQSGTIGAALECWAEDEGIGIAKFAMLGNKSDIDEIELLDYMAKDRRTRVIALYLEGITDGRKFLEIAKKAARKKPVVVLKGGRTEKGAEAVLTHTRSLAGRYEVFRSACRQVGLINVSSVEELYDVCKGFARIPKPEGRNTVVVTSSGGSGILATDTSEEIGLKLMDLPEKAVKRLKKGLPPECIIRNPLDLTGSATSKTYKDALKVLTTYDDVHSIIMIVGDPMPGIAETVERYFNRVTLVPVMLGGGEAEAEERKKLEEKQIPVYSSPSRAVRVLSVLT
jgi:acetyl coenzyme A synthetase (ADP forming)-like protein